MRHPLAVVLAATVCAVAAAARSDVAIAEWVADHPPRFAAALGRTEESCESTIRRAVERLDGDRFDAAISTWIQQQLRAACQPAGRRRPAVAVDEKILRGT